MGVKMNIAIVFAGGNGTRMKSAIPKQFIAVNGKPILVHTLNVYQNHPQIDRIYLTVLEEYIPYVKTLLEEYKITKVKSIVPGGQTAQESIYNALKEAEKENEGNSIVLLHDGVRPYLSQDVISKNIQKVKEKGNAITCSRCHETVLLSKDRLCVDSVPIREECYSAQAPQSFYLQDIIHYHDLICASKDGYKGMVDACSIITKLGVKAYLVQGNQGNIKITTPEDIYMFRALLQYKENEQIFFLGFDESCQSINR